MSPQGRRRPRHKLLLSTAWLSAITIFTLVSWLYIFRHGSSYYIPTAQPSPALPVANSDSDSNTVTVFAETKSSTLIFSRTSTPSSSVSASSSPSPVMPTSPSATMKVPGDPGSATGPEVKLRQGTYVGTTLAASTRFPKAIEAFRGIPYAESTAGENRFRPPVPVKPSTATYDAASFGKACPSSNFAKVADEGEDCLNLHVYRPQGLTDSGNLSPDGRPPAVPVVIYVHGGGFNGGIGIERNMASFVSWAKEPIVGVNFNYRVGALGFLPSALTAREGLLNLGLRDQQLMFAWVQDNIAAFGGDPDNVTIMGLSAGAHSIGHHLMYYSRTPAAAPFAKAILESGATTARATFYPTHPRHLVQFREFLVAAGIEGIREEEIFTTLRKLPVSIIVRASRSVWDRYEDSVCWPFQPVIDGPNPLSNSSYAGINGKNATAIIPDLPITSWRESHHLCIPVLTGFNTNEGTMFIPAKADTSEQFREFFSTLIPSLSQKDLDTLEFLYPDPVTDPVSLYKVVPKGMGHQWARLDAAYSHYAYICPVLQTAHFLSPSTDSPDSSFYSKVSHPHPLSSPSSPSPSLRTVPPPAVYVYRYAATGRWGTASHGDEALIVAHDMDTLASLIASSSAGGEAKTKPQQKPTPIPGLRALSDAMHAAWVNFIVYGNPNNPFAESSSRNDQGAGADVDTDTNTLPIHWPPFKDPFPNQRPSSSLRRFSPSSSSSSGKIIVFGEGNDERKPGSRGTRHPSTVAKIETLSAHDMERCQFWWDRVELSEGVGRRKEDRARL